MAVGSTVEMIDGEMVGSQEAYLLLRETSLPRKVIAISTPRSGRDNEDRVMARKIYQSTCAAARQSVRFRPSALR